jgi:hypothetical protein
MKKLDNVVCDVCFVILDEHNQFKKSPEHFCDVCKEHKEFAKTFLIDVVAENLGFKDVEKDRECEVCNKILTNKEVQNSLNEKSFHFLCENHLKKYARLYMLPNNAR